MTDLVFGQPDNGIIQLGFLVPDLEGAMAEWTSRLGAGPWFVLEAFAGVDPRYRGEETRSRADIALGFAGHMQIELIRPCDDLPSVYQSMIQRGAYGFHHFGLATRAFEQDLAARTQGGDEVVFTAAVPGGGRVAHLETSTPMPGLIELIDVNDAIEQMFDAMYQASVDWDGSEPVRRLGV